MSPLTGAAFDRSVLPWSGRSDEGLAPLWRGAEAYIRTWENAQEVVRQLYP
jgi:hypothetical protein